MTQSDTPTLVGKQLAARREELDLTQQAIAHRIGITVNSVSAAENGRATISRGKRPAWEAALELAPGSIQRAYAGGALEPLKRAAEPDSDPKPYADLDDRHERAIWAMDLSEADRRVLVDLWRKSRLDGRRTA
ncbi:helix-turn-helix transcriptional regulator [Streptomyces sp. NPDC059255]|uniref:helix-turn-helix transcriptional regulator n=1 Tax=Streptomyces sp. NPDC059255 TaxID=3346793 RepID=UPI0036B6540D